MTKQLLHHSSGAKVGIIFETAKYLGEKVLIIFKCLVDIKENKNRKFYFRVFICHSARLFDLQRVMP